MHVNYHSISSSKFIRNLPDLVQVVEEKIAILLPYYLFLVVNCWSTGTRHYRGLFTSFSAESFESYSTLLSAFPPSEYDPSFGWEEHISIIDCLLDLFAKNWNNPPCLIVDNCSLNKFIATKLLCPFQSVQPTASSILSKISWSNMRTPWARLAFACWSIESRHLRQNSSIWAPLWCMLRILGVEIHLFHTETL